MSYNPSIPNVGDFTAISQKQMLANFQAINSTFLIDHIPLTAVEDVGKHNSLTLRPQLSDPVTAANQSALYNKLVTSVPQLFFRPSSNATPIQMSNSNLNTIQTGAGADVQSSFLAGPFTIYMGYIKNCPSLQVVTLLPATTLKYVGLSTALVGGLKPGRATTATAAVIAANQFTVVYNTAELTIPPIIYYMAIGQ